MSCSIFYFCLSGDFILLGAHNFSEEEMESEFSSVSKMCNVRDRSLIKGREGLYNGKIAGPKLLCHPLETG